MARRDFNRRDFIKAGAATGAIASFSALPGRAKADPAGSYVKNRAPLLETPFIPLPIGAVRADGWLLHQLELMASGVTGSSEHVYSELGSNCAWLGANQGSMADGSDWERPPYYVKGLVALAYTLNNRALIDKVQKWINWAIASQQSSGPYAGAFGPSWSYFDWWPRMPMLYAMKDFYEATSDSRILPFLTRYFRFQANNIGANPITSWARARVGDNIDVALWLYNRSGEDFLLALVDRLRGQALDFTDMLTNNGFHQEAHGVNVAQYMKTPAVLYQRSHAAADRDAFIAGHNHLMRDHGQVVDLPSGTEWLAGRSSNQGVELCTIVERMHSNQRAQMIIGDPAIGDQLEKMTFNSLPGAMDKSGRLHQYYSLPNHYQAIRGFTGFGQDHLNGLVLGPHSGYPCCRFNLHIGWPYYVKNMWAATNDQGVAAMAYGPSRVTVRVGSEAVDANITQWTNYPFEDEILFAVSVASPVAFPFKLRIPAWAAGPSILVNGVPQSGVTSGTFYTIDRVWEEGDRVLVKFPMPLKASTQINDSIALERGPLVFSLKMDEIWHQIWTGPLPGFNEYEIRPGRPWNYGLVLNRSNPSASVSVQTSPMPANPFDASRTPVRLIANARRVPWGTIQNGTRAADVLRSPFASNSPTEQITLVPWGAQNTRMTYFPEVRPVDQVVTFYTDENYMGTGVPFGPGEYDYDQLENAGLINDSMTSIRIPQGWTVEVYDHNAFTGSRWVYTSDTPNVLDGVNDRMSSVRIFAP